MTFQKTFKYYNPSIKILCLTEFIQIVKNMATRELVVNRKKRTVHLNLKNKNLFEMMF